MTALATQAGCASTGAGTGRLLGFKSVPVSTADSGMTGDNAAFKPTA